MIASFRLALATFLLAAPVLAAPPGGAGPNPGKTALGMLQRLDTDADGSLSLDEVLVGRAAEAERHFARIDTDGDGLLMPGEGSRRHRHHGADIDNEALRECLGERLEELPEPQADPSARFEAADTDGNGLLDLDEFVAAGAAEASARFARADQDGDGRLGREELGAALRRHAQAAQALRECLHGQAEAQGLFGPGPF
jgi:Ca2+-binding EF-hand superfamily protein